MKREGSCQHGVDDNASGPDVNFFLVATFVQDLGGHISWCAARFEHNLARDYDFAKTKIRQLDLVHLVVVSLGIELNHDVFGLQVSMCDSTQMQIL